MPPQAHDNTRSDGRRGERRKDSEDSSGDLWLRIESTQSVTQRVDSRRELTETITDSNVQIPTV